MELSGCSHRLTSGLVAGSEVTSARDHPLSVHAVEDAKQGFGFIHGCLFG